MKEREKGKVGVYKRRVYIYIRGMIIIRMPSHSNLRLIKRMAASRQNELDTEMRAASRENARFAFARKDKKAWFRIDLASIKCSMESLPTLNVEPRLVKLASSEEREKWKREK